MTERNAPMRLRTAEMATAVKGFRAPVAIDVAMALAVSWKPLVKSKASAVMTTMAKMISVADTSVIPFRTRAIICKEGSACRAQQGGCGDCVLTALDTSPEKVLRQLLG